MDLGPSAWRRLRAGPAAYSLCGVTHTISTRFVLNTLARHPLEPLMDWDALICTSQVALEVVSQVYDEAEAQHRWRTGGTERLARPMLPVIPLGIHCGDFQFTPADRAAARSDLGLEPDTVAVLSAGRLSIGAKAHPYPLLTALERATRATGQDLALIFAGQAFSPAVVELYRKAAAEFCPSVWAVFVDGADAARYRGAWAASDIFTSLSDSIQETFGLTPVEAMAAGLPALVSDWNGYRDTVRDGVDGFRIPTWAPEPGVGQRIGFDFEAEAITADTYFYRASAAVSLNPAVLDERLSALVSDEALRRRMGAAGQARARESFDWSVVYASYQALWAEQDAIRRRAAADPATSAWLASAPKHSPGHKGPFDTFQHFPTRHLGARTVVARGGIASQAAYEKLMAHGLFSFWHISPQIFGVIHAALADGALTIEDLAARTGIAPGQVIEAVARLAKVDAVAISQA
jgi:glycosyltransferase involved in cell wall biosynthesis